MGPRETPPPLPDIEPDMVEAEAAQVWTALRECNWVVAMPSAALLKATLAPDGVGAISAEDSSRLLINGSPADRSGNSLKIPTISKVVERSLHVNVHSCYADAPFR